MSDENTENGGKMNDEARTTEQASTNGNGDAPSLLSAEREPDWLKGRLLIATPSMPDERFERAVIYLCNHDAEGAMGIVLNRIYGELDFEELLNQLKIQPPAMKSDIQVHFGGPVEAGRGFVLHSTDVMREGTVVVDGDIALTGTLDMLEAMASGDGPRKSIFALGYAQWGPGQLDQEIQTNGWLVGNADDELVFETGIDEKWEQALTRSGIQPSMLSGSIGHA